MRPLASSSYSLGHALTLAAVSALLILVVAALDGRSAAAVGSPTLGVDADPAGNTAGSLGPIDKCRSVAAGETFQIDLWVQDMDGLAGWQTYLNYDPTVLNVLSYEVGLFLLQNPGGPVLDLSEPVPDNDGQFLMAVADLYDLTGELGSGIVARLTLEAVGSGYSPLALSGVLLLHPDASPIGDVDGDDLFDGPLPGAIVWVGQPCPGDPDGDGVDPGDNCPDIGNPDQGDKDDDGIGDWCDDGDRDYVLDAHDNCPNTVSLNQQGDLDGDGLGDVCDPDRDGDGVPNDVDNAPDIFNPDQVDTDGDTTPDVADLDVDNDGVPDKRKVGGTCCVDLDGDGDGSSDASEFVVPTVGLPLGAKQETSLCCPSNGTVYMAFVGVAYLWTTVEVLDLDGDTELEVSLKDYGQPPGQQQTYDLSMGDPDADIDIIVIGGGPLGLQAAPQDVDGDAEKEAMVWEPQLASGAVVEADSDSDGDADVRWANAPVAGIDNCPDAANPDQTNTDAALAGAGASVPPDALGDACDGDDDNDGFPDAIEAALSTAILHNCPATTIPNDEPDAWPPDADDDRDADIGDAIALFRGIILSPPTYQTRSDFDADGDVDIGDAIAAFGSGRILTSCA